MQDNKRLKKNWEIAVPFLVARHPPVIAIDDAGKLMHAPNSASKM